MTTTIKKSHDQKIVINKSDWSLSGKSSLGILKKWAFILKSYLAFWNYTPHLHLENIAEILKSPLPKSTQTSNLLTPHPAIYAQDQRFGFHSYFQKFTKTSLLSDTIEIGLSDHRFSISTPQNPHTLPSQSPPNPYKPIKEVAHSLISHIFNFVITTSKPPPF